MAKRPTGVSTGAIETSPARRRRQDKRRRAEEAAWAARNGPVVVRQVDPAELQRDAPASSSAATDDVA